MSFETYFGHSADIMIFDELYIPPKEVEIAPTITKLPASKPITTLADNIKFICANWSVLSKATIWDFYQPALETLEGK